MFGNFQRIEMVESMKPIYARNVRVLGVVSGVIRKL